MLQHVNCSKSFSPRHPFLCTSWWKGHSTSICGSLYLLLHVMKSVLYLAHKQWNSRSKKSDHVTNAVLDRFSVGQLYIVLSHICVTVCVSCREKSRHTGMLSLPLRAMTVRTRQWRLCRPHGWHHRRLTATGRHTHSQAESQRPLPVKRCRCRNGENMMPDVWKSAVSTIQSVSCYEMCRFCGWSCADFMLWCG